jgi:hypothetical protein
MSTYLLNISNQALTKSTGHVFLRQFRIGANNYGIDKTGIHLITGDLDNGSGFDSVIKTSANTLGEEAMKRLPEIRVDKNGLLNSALIYDGSIVGEGIEAGESGFIRFGKGGGGKLVSLIMHTDDENFKLRSIKLMPQTIGLGAL